MMKLLLLALLGLLLPGITRAMPVEDDDAIDRPMLRSRALRNSSSSEEEATIPSEEGVSHRNTIQVRTTLIHVANGDDDDDDLTPEEIIYFEDTWIRIFNEIFVVNGPSDDHRLRSFVVEEVLGNDDDIGRALKRRKEKGRLKKGRRPRGISSYKWFDTWALMETSCRYCGKDDDDRRMLSDSLLQEFEHALCDSLRQGPFPRFESLEDCPVLFDEE